GTSSARYTYARFGHALATDPALAQALADSSQGPQTAIFVQSLGGIRSELRFPYLDRFTDSPYRAVAKAELVMPLAGEHHDTYAPPGQLFVFRKADDGSDLLVPDQISGQGQVGGFYDEDNQ